MKKYVIFLAWLSIPVLFGLFIFNLPEASIESVIITQIPFLALSGIIGFYLLKNRLPENVIKIATGFAGLAGLAFAGYLALKWSQGTLPNCSAGGCVKAQYSSYAELFFGIRTTTVGIIGYCLVLLSLIIKGNIGRATTAILGTIGIAVSFYLTYSSVFVLDTTCQWCLGSASAMTTIFTLSMIRLWLYLKI